MPQNATERISIAHANAVAHAAVHAGQATWGTQSDRAFTPSPELAAHLDDLGIQGLASMNEHQANAVIAFIERPAAARRPVRL